MDIKFVSDFLTDLEIAFPNPLKNPQDILNYFCRYKYYINTHKVNEQEIIWLLKKITNFSTKIEDNLLNIEEFQNFTINIVNFNVFIYVNEETKSTLIYSFNLIKKEYFFNEKNIAFLLKNNNLKQKIYKILSLLKNNNYTEFCFNINPYTKEDFYEFI